MPECKSKEPVHTVREDNEVGNLCYTVFASSTKEVPVTYLTPTINLLGGINQASHSDFIYSSIEIIA